MEAKIYLQIFGLMALSAIANSMGNLKSVPSSACQCLPVQQLNFCGSHFGYNWDARFPNARGHTDVGTAIAELSHYATLFQLDNYCSHMLYNLLCFHYLPQCAQGSPITVVACREVCIEAKDACLEHARRRDPNYMFPEHLNCSKFDPGVPDCNVINGAEDSSGCTETCPLACPRPTPHVEFAATEPLCGDEGGNLTVCIRLANVGSYDNNDTLEENVTITITLCKIRDGQGYAQPGIDFDNSTIEVTFPNGSSKGAALYIAIPLLHDGIEEPDEYFKVKVEVTSPSGALFGGNLNSSSGSILAKINASTAPTSSPAPPSISPTQSSAVPTSSPVPTPTASPLPSVPAPECKSSDCNWRQNVNRRTLNKRSNGYTFAAVVQVLHCNDTVLCVNMTMCKSINTCGKCPSSLPTKLKIPVCPNCAQEISSLCSEGGEILIAGKDLDDLLFIPNYKKGGILAPSILQDWKSTITDCTG